MSVLPPYGAKVIVPMEITDAALVYSNVPEPDADIDGATEWDSEAEYQRGDLCIRGHVIYKAADDNTGVDPAADAEPLARWVPLGATNRWRMFDDAVDSQTQHTGPIIVDIKPGHAVQSIGLINAQGRAARITMTDPVHGVVYQREIALVGTTAANLWSWLFGWRIRRPYVVVDGLPSYTQVVIRIEILADEGQSTAVGHVIVSRRVIALGCAQWGLRLGMVTYSSDETNAFGHTTLVRRKSVRRREMNIVIDTQRVEWAEQQLASVDATPCLYVGSSQHGATMAYGVFESFDIVLASPVISECSITIRGVLSVTRRT